MTNNKERDKELLEKAPEFDPDDLLRPLGLTQVGICEDGREINRKIVRNYFDQLRLKLAALRESDVTCPACCETWSLIDGKQLNEEFHGLHAEAKANWLKVKELREELKEYEKEFKQVCHANDIYKAKLSEKDDEMKNKFIVVYKDGSWLECTIAYEYEDSPDWLCTIPLTAHFGGRE